MAWGPTYCLGTNKTNLRWGLEHPLEESLLAELVRFRANATTADAEEGHRSFRDRDNPVYDGRGPAQPSRGAQASGDGGRPGARDGPPSPDAT